MIYIIRHGQTELNIKNVLQGRSDYSLNAAGEAQAQEAGEWFAGRGITFSHIFSSPLQRAVRTAEIIAPDVKVNIDERLIEMDYGPYEGADLKAPPPELMRFFSDFSGVQAPDGMERLADVVKRTGAFMEEIKALDGNILISTHAVAMKGILEYLTPQSNGGYWSEYIGNCAVYEADNSGGALGIPVPAQRNRT